MLGRLSEQIGGSIPFACQDWAATKAAYRLLSNERINEEKILAGHFFCTREQTAATHANPMLVLHDTMEFIYRREEPHAIGIVHKSLSWASTLKRSAENSRAHRQPDRDLVHPQLASLLDDDDQPLHAESLP